MFDQVFAAVKQLAVTHAAPYTEIANGSMPTENGLAIYPGPGAPADSFFDRGATYQISVVLNGKHSNLQTLTAALSAIHTGLTQTREYPKTDDWQILSIETATPPNYVGREESDTRQWLYGSILSVRFHIKGV